jgi:hypothetical protein
VEELNFIDLVILQRIEPGTVMEKFGPKINSQFFETANILATLKQKGYIDFKTSSFGNSEVEVTQVGARMLEVADEKAKEAVDELDVAILQKIIAGYTDPEDIKNMLNIRSGDLAVHIQKLVKQDLVSYSIRNIKVSLNITEDGFKKAGPAPKSENLPSEQMMAAPSAPVAEAAPAAPAEPQAPPEPAGPVKLDRQGRMNAKIEYYKENFRKHPAQLAVYVIAALIVVACILGAVYMVFFGK